VLGPRGEHLPTQYWVGGPLRDTYTQPAAIDLANKGQYQAAEAAETGMCPTCHILTQTGTTNFSIGGYVRSYASGGLQAVKIALKGNPVGAAYNAGVDLKDAVLGTDSTAGTSDIIDRLVPVDQFYPAIYPGSGFDPGAPSVDSRTGATLSTGTRILKGVSAATVLVPTAAGALARLAGAVEPVPLETGTGGGGAGGGGAGLPEVDTPPLSQVQPLPDSWRSQITPDGITTGEITNQMDIKPPGQEWGQFSEQLTLPDGPKGLGDAAARAREILASQGPSRGNGHFLTLDGALIAASGEINLPGAQSRLELGGFLFRRWLGLGSYGYSEPQIGNPTTVTPVNPKLPFLARVEGLYHGHVLDTGTAALPPGNQGYWGEIFSQQDIASADYFNKPIGVITPSGAVMKYTPNLQLGTGRGDFATLGQYYGNVFFRHR
jgi:hypothetical protein